MGDVLSLFDGMSCCQQALNRSGFKYKNYYASEVDKHAIKVTQHNFPKTIQLGDVRLIDGNNLPNIGLLTAGSPCTDFSIMGKKRGMSTENNYEITSLNQYLELKDSGFIFIGQSYLYWEFVRLLDEIEPKYFLLENVRMSDKWRDIISNTLRYDPIMINSSLVSAQNRERYYWTNIPNVTIPKDKKITLDQIIPGAVGSGKRGVKKHRDDDFYTVCQTERKDGKANCLVTSSRSTNCYVKDGVFTVLSPEEAEVLQTVDVGYTNVEGISNHQRYRMLGNGWTIDVISHIFKNMRSF